MHGNGKKLMWERYQEFFSNKRVLLGSPSRRVGPCVRKIGTPWQRGGDQRHKGGRMCEQDVSGRVSRHKRRQAGE